MERLKTKDVSQRVKVDTTPPSPDGLSVEISPAVTLGRDPVASLEAEQVEGKVNLIAVEGTKKNSQKWVVKKRGSQIDELNQLKLKVVVLHDGIGKEVYMTQPVRFIHVDLKIIDLVA